MTVPLSYWAQYLIFCVRTECIWIPKTHVRLKEQGLWFCMRVLESSGYQQVLALAGVEYLPFIFNIAIIIVLKCHWCSSTLPPCNSVVWRPWVLSSKCEDTFVTQNLSLSSVTIVTFLHFCIVEGSKSAQWLKSRRQITVVANWRLKYIDFSKWKTE